MKKPGDKLPSTAGAAAPDEVAFRVDPALAGFRLDQFLKRMIPRLSRRRIQQAIAQGVRLSWDAQIKPSTPVREAGVVFVPLRAREARSLPALDISLRVLFESEELLAVDKPSGMVVHPTNDHDQDTVISLLRRVRSEPALTLAHRLDGETSGVLLLCRTRSSARRTQTAFERGKVGKAYLAVVHGRVDRSEWSIDQPLGSLSRDGVVFRQSPDAKHARSAQTQVTTLATSEGASVLRAIPVTGRRHQIRAHLALAGFPVVGDKLYTLEDRPLRTYLRQRKLPQSMQERLGADRTMLHNQLLEIPPGIRIVAPLPPDLRQVLQRFGFDPAPLEMT